MDLQLRPSELAKIFMDEFTMGCSDEGAADQFIRTKLRETSFAERLFPAIVEKNKKWFSTK